MIVDPSIPQPQPLPAMGVRSSSDIVDHLDRVLKSQPPEVQAAVDHAHGIMGMNPPSGAVTAAPESSAAPSLPASAPIDTPPSINSSGPDPALIARPSISMSPSDAQPLPRPIAVAPPNPHMENLERMTKEGPGVNKIHNPFLRGLAHVGDAIGSGIFPEFTSFIPGFTAHHNQLIDEEENQLGNEQKAAKSTADVARSDAATELDMAQVPHIKAETDAILNPKPKNEFDLFFKQNPNGTVTDFVKQQEAGKDPTNPYQIWRKEPSNAGKGYVDFLKAEAGAKPPSNELELYVKTHPDEANPLAGYEHEKQNITSKPLTKETADAMNANYDTIGPKYGLPRGQFHEGMTSAEATQVKSAMLGAIAGTQKGQNITINEKKADAAAARDPNTEKEYKSVHDDLNKKFATTETQLQNADQALAEINSGAMGQAFGTIKSLVALAGGQGSGVRITQAELNSIAKARGLGGDFEGWFNSIAGKGKLSGEQVQQLNSVLAEVKRKGEEKRSLLSGTLDKLATAKNTQEIRAIEKEYRDAGMVDPNVKAYADAHFGGDVAKAQAAIAEQKKSKK